MRVIFGTRVNQCGLSADFENEVEAFPANLPVDFRFAANGHDAICLLSHFFKGFCKKGRVEKKARDERPKDQ